MIDPRASALLDEERKRLEVVQRAQIALEVLRLPKHDSDGVSAEVCAAANEALLHTLKPSPRLPGTPVL